MIALINYATELHNGTLHLVSHWNTDVGRISAATPIVPDLSDEQILEVVRGQLKSHVASLEHTAPHLAQTVEQ